MVNLELQSGLHAFQDSVQCKPICVFWPCFSMFRERLTVTFFVKRVLFNVIVRISTSVVVD